MLSTEPFSAPCKHERLQPELRKSAVPPAIMKEVQHSMAALGPLYYCIVAHPLHRATVSVVDNLCQPLSCLQDAMRSAEKAGTEECPVKMKLLAPPLYVLTTQTLEKNKGIEALTAACSICKKVIDGHKGRLVIKEAARAVSERDDRLLNDQVCTAYRQQSVGALRIVLASCFMSKVSVPLDICPWAGIHSGSHVQRACKIERPKLS